MDMKNPVEGVAKRLLFSLAVLGALGGCAVYDTGYNYPYYNGAYYTDPYYPGGAAYGYGAGPLYPGGALYLAPPAFRFDYHSGGGYYRHNRGHGWHNGGGLHNGGGSHHWNGGRPGPQGHPGMRGGGRWGSAGTWHGRG